MAKSITTWTTVSCSNTAGQALAANGNRRGFVLQNKSDVDLYLLVRKTSSADTTEVTSSNGLKLGPDENWIMDGPEVPDGEIRVITASGSSKTLLVSEW